MRTTLLFSATLLMTCVSIPMVAGAATETNGTTSGLTAAQIVERNVQARGGLTAWRAVHSLEMKGKMDAGGNNRPTIPVPGVRKADAAPQRPAEQVKLPFVMDLERGRKQRIEIEFKGQTAVQVYDGKQGWKLRPFLNRHDVEKFTPEELQAAATQSDLDGLLIDYAAKGSHVELQGVDQIEGHKAYNLKVTDSAGHARHVWVDAENFLEIKIEGTPRRLDGKYHPVATYMRDYRSVNGLIMPYLLETVVEGYKEKEQIQIESIVSNPKLDESRFGIPR